jgi:hypothetical protein
MFRDWMRLCFKFFKDPANLSELHQLTLAFDKLFREGQKNMILYCINILREILVFKNSGKQLIRLPEADLEFVEKIAPHVSNTGLEKISTKLNEVYYYIERNANAKMAFMSSSFYIASVFSKKQ